MKDYFNAISTNNLTPNQTYLLYSIRDQTTPAFINVHQELRCLTPEWVNPTTTNLTAKSILFLKSMDALIKPVKSKTVAGTADQVLSADHLHNVAAYRELFPSGMLPTGAPSRSSVPELDIKFQKFFRVFPQISWDNVLEATAVYVSKFAEQEYEFMKNSTNFISKTDQQTSTIVYELASRCDLLNQPQSAITPQHYTIRSV